MDNGRASMDTRTGIRRQLRVWSDHTKVRRVSATPEQVSASSAILIQLALFAFADSHARASASKGANDEMRRRHRRRSDRSHCALCRSGVLAPFLGQWILMRHCR